MYYKEEEIPELKIAENVGKYLVTEETEETPKTTCTGNQPWAARFVENILNTRETEDTLQKTTCAEHSEVAQFVENILDLEETKDTPEKMTLFNTFWMLKKLKTHQRIQIEFQIISCH